MIMISPNLLCMAVQWYWYDKYFQPFILVDIDNSFPYVYLFTGNLVGMGLIPLQYKQGENADSLGLTGKEQYSINIPSDLTTGQELQVQVRMRPSLCWPRSGWNGQIISLLMLVSNVSSPDCAYSTILFPLLSFTSVNLIFPFGTLWKTFPRHL